MPRPWCRSCFVRRTQSTKTRCIHLRHAWRRGSRPLECHDQLRRETAGRRSYHPSSGFLKADGIFFMTGPDSQPAAQPATRAPGRHHGRHQQHAAVFGERSRWDPNYDTFAAQGWDWAFRYYGNWCGDRSAGAGARDAQQLLPDQLPPAVRLRPPGRRRARRPTAPPISSTTSTCGCAPLGATIPAGPISRCATAPSASSPRRSP